MKKTQLFFYSLALSFLFACGSGETDSNSDNNQETGEEQVTGMDLSGMEVHDLSSYEIPVSIYLPSSMGKPEMILTDWGSLEIHLGDQFGLEIVPFGLSTAEKKTELEADLVYQTEFTEESPSLLVYKKSIADSAIEPEHHFFMNLDISGEIYEVKSLPSLSLTKNQLEKILKSAKSIEIKEAV